MVVRSVRRCCEQRTSLINISLKIHTQLSIAEEFAAAVNLSFPTVFTVMCQNSERHCDRDDEIQSGSKNGWQMTSFASLLSDVVVPTWSLSN